MKAKDFINTLEYMKTFAPKEKKSRRPTKDKSEFDIRDVDAIALLQAEHRRSQDIQKFLEELVKLNKKDDKKDEKKKDDSGMGVMTLACFLIAFSPITGLFYMWMLRSMFGLH